MLIGEEGAVSDLWEAARKKLPRPRLDRPGQPVYAITDPPPAGRHGPAAGHAWPTSISCCPSCAAAHHEELGVDPLRRDPDGFRWRTRDADRGGEIVALGRGRRDPVQGGGLRVDACRRCSCSRCGRTHRPARQGFAGRALRDLIRLLLERTPTVCLFVRAENAPGDQAVRVGRHAPRARLPLRAAVTVRGGAWPCTRRLILARHAHAASNVGDDGQRDPAGRGPLAAGRRGGRRARRLLATEPIDLGVSSRFRRAAARPSSSHSPGADVPARRRAAPRRDRLRLVRGRHAGRVPRVGLGARRPRPRARVAARRASTPRVRFAAGLDCAARPARGA